MLGYVMDGVGYVNDYWADEYSKPKKDARYWWFFLVVTC
jgi:hypothetical protein